MIGKKDEKRAAEHTQRMAEAAQWRQDGHARYVYLVKASATWNGGHLADVSREIEAIEAGGWRLEQATWSARTMVMLVFRAVS
jgi:hypothetical protein